MYTVILNDIIAIHDERTTFLIEPTLSRAINKAGVFSFGIPKGNPGYNQITPRRSLVQIYRGTYSVTNTASNYLLWSGVVLSYTVNMYGEKEVICEGALSVLNDTSFSAIHNVINGTIEEFLDLDFMRMGFKSQHNDAIFEGGNSLAVYFPAQVFPGKMHFYIKDADGNNKELIKSEGFTASALSGLTLYFKDNLYVACESADGSTSVQKLTIGIIYRTAHAVSNTVTPSFVPGNTDYRSLWSNTNIWLTPSTLYTCSFSEDFRAISSMSAEMPIGGKDVVFNPSFKDAFCSSYEKLMKIIDKYGGYITANVSKSGISIEYKETFTEISGQKIVLGDNLQDYVESLNFENIYNKIIPFGKNLGTSFLWEYVTIESVNNGCNYIINDESANQLGPITKVMHYPDVDDPAQLKRLAQKDLDSAVNFELSVSVKAADKAMLSDDVNADAFDIGLLTEIEIPPLGIARSLICTSITNYLSEPEKDEYTFGSVPKTSSGYVASGGTGSSDGGVEIISSQGKASAAFTLLNEEVYLIGKCVFVSLKLKNNNSISSGNSNVCYTLPEGYCPVKEANILVNVNVNNCAVGWIRTSGEVVITPNFAMSANTEIRIMSHFYRK